MINDRDLVGDGIVHMAHPNPADFIIARNEDWFAKADVLAERAAKGTRKDLGATEVAYGMVYKSSGALWQPELRQDLRRTKTFTYDGMHALLSNGLAHTEVKLKLSKLPLIGCPSYTSDDADESDGVDLVRRIILKEKYITNNSGVE